jgi:hypothetical protein
MKNRIKQISCVAIVACLLTSFALVDFTKTLVGKWELKTIQQPGKAAMPTKDILGESFMEFKSDFTYEESGGSQSSGVWQITSGKYIQTKENGRPNFTEKMELKEIAPDKIQITSSSKTSMVYQRIQ